MGWFSLGEQEELYWNKFEVGGRADIVLSMDLQENYSTTIDAVSEDNLVLQTPRIGNSVLEIRPKTGIIVNIYTENGIFKFKSRVVTQDWKQDYSITIEKPRKIERIQQRQYYRLGIILPMEYGIIPGREKDLYSLDKITTNLMGVTKNISEGGMLLVLDKTLSVSMLLKTRVNLATDTWIEAVAKVVEQKLMEVKNKYITRVQFVSISDDDKEIIRKFVLTHIRRA